jgi:photosystem II stability/assembly factor-like uncharacterized protein
MLSESDGWALGEHAVLRTSDGGLTWQKVGPADLSDLGYAASAFFLSGQTAWVAVSHPNDPQQGSLYRTIDGGQTWNSASLDFGLGRLYFLDDQQGWALADLGAGAGSNAVAIYQTTDGGSSWQRTYTNDPTDPEAGDSLPLGGIKNGFAAIDMQTAWVSGVIYRDDSIYLYVTHDGGRSWSQPAVSLPGNVTGAQVMASGPEFFDAKNGVLFVSVGGASINLYVYSTHDGGQSWTPSQDYVSGGGKADFFSPTAGVIWGFGQFNFTDDAGDSWKIITSGVDFGENFAGMDFIDAQTGWVITADATDHRSLYKTSDSGRTWNLLIP